MIWKEGVRLESHCVSRPMSYRKNACVNTATLNDIDLNTLNGVFMYSVMYSVKSPR